MIILAAAIKIFSLYPGLVEQYYANGIYPWIGLVQRMIFGWIPLSVGDFLYASAGVWLIYRFILFVRTLRRRQADRKYWTGTLLKSAVIALYVYVVFNLLWGLNYNRYGIDYQVKLDMLDYNNEDLKVVTKGLAMRMNALQQQSANTRDKLRKKRPLFEGAVQAYGEYSSENPFMFYRYASVKPSIFSYLGNYLGFTGYYNPFTGEAQVNTTVPVFIQPFVTCHEIGHQLGYAKESEANFAAYLTGTASRDPSFQYSVYFEMYAYAARYLAYSDSVALKSINESLSPQVKGDIRKLREFYRRYDNPFETYVDRLYSQYLKANEQPSGQMSYNEVVAMLIAYYKKTGRI